MPENNHDSYLLNRNEAAKYLGLAPGTLAVWDCTKRYNLNPIKLGSRVLYRRQDLDAFVDRQLQPQKGR